MQNLVRKKAQRVKFGWGQGQFGPEMCHMIVEILMSAERYVSMCGIHMFLGIGAQRQCLNMGLYKSEILLRSIYERRCARSQVDCACVAMLRQIPRHFKLGGPPSDSQRAYADKFVN